MSGKPKSKRRSGCPVSVSLEILGDRWSLLIIRDLMVRGFRTFKEFAESGEDIATNILADRLKKLEFAGIIAAEERQHSIAMMRKIGVQTNPAAIAAAVYPGDLVPNVGRCLSVNS